MVLVGCGVGLQVQTGAGKVDGLGWPGGLGCIARFLGSVAAVVLLTAAASPVFFFTNSAVAMYSSFLDRFLP